LLYGDGQSLYVRLKGEDGVQRYYPVYPKRKGEDSAVMEVGYPDENGNWNQRALLSNTKANQAIRKYLARHQTSLENDGRWTETLNDYVRNSERDAKDLDYSEYDEKKIYAKGDQVFLPVDGKLEALYTEDGKIVKANGDALSDDQVVALMNHYRKHENTENGWGKLPAENPRRKQIEAFLKSEQLKKSLLAKGITDPGSSGGGGLGGDPSKENLFCSNPVDAICNAAYSPDGSKKTEADVKAANIDREKARGKLRDRAFLKVADKIRSLKAAAAAATPPVEVAEPWKGLSENDAAAFFRKLYMAQSALQACTTEIAPRAGLAPSMSTSCAERVSQFNELASTYMEALADKVTTTEQSVAETVVRDGLARIVESPTGLPDVGASAALAIRNTPYLNFKDRVAAIAGVPAPGVPASSDEQKAFELNRLMALCGSDMLSPNIINDGKLTLCPWTVVEASGKASERAIDTTVTFDPSPDKLMGIAARAYAEPMERAYREQNIGRRNEVAACLKENYGKADGVTDLLKNAEGESVHAEYMTKGMIQQYGAAEYLYSKIKDRGSKEDRLRLLADSYGLFCADWRPGSDGKAGQIWVSQGGNTVDPAVSSTAPTQRFSAIHGSAGGDLFGESRPGVSEADSMAAARKIDNLPNITASREPHPDTVLREVLGLHPGIRKEMGCDTVAPKSREGKDFATKKWGADNKVQPLYCSPFYKDGQK
jgi:hypothetical protein